MESAAYLALFVFFGTVCGRRLEILGISQPMVFVLLGTLAGPAVTGLIDLTPTTESTLWLTEITLGVLLFADASSLRARQLRPVAGVVGRLLVVGLPLSIAAGGCIALLLFPDSNTGILLLIGAALAPTDAALGLPIFRNPQIPIRVRRALNVESGLNDGLVTPFVSLFLSLALSEAVKGQGHWLTDAGTEILIAVTVGLGFGITSGAIIRAVLVRNWCTEDQARVTMLAAALATFFGSGALGGNQFIAAFVGGLGIAGTLGSSAEETRSLTEQTGTSLSLVVWLLFGALMVPHILDGPDTARSVLYAVLALTVMRMVPVATAMIGTGFRRDTVAVLGWFGPRGLASVVFLMTAYAELESEDVAAELLRSVMTWTILLSVVAHGVSAGPLGSWYGRRLRTAPADLPELRG